MIADRVDRATITVARTNWVSEIQATRPELSTRSRAARGASRTSQAQIRSPSARKKYVENSTMKKPATTWPDRGADLGHLAEDLAVLGPLGDRLLGAGDVLVDLGVAGVQRPVVQPVLDLVEALDHLVGEVVGAVGDLLAGEGEQRDDRDQTADDHEPAPASRRGAARRRCSRSTSGMTSAVISRATTSGSTTTAKNAEQPSDHVAGGRDDQEPPGPGRGQVDALRHLGAAEVRRAAGDDRLRGSGAALGAGSVPLVGDAAGRSRSWPRAGDVVAPRRRVGRRRLVAVLGGRWRHAFRLSARLGAGDPPPRIAPAGTPPRGCSAGEQPAAAST